MDTKQITKEFESIYARDGRRIEARATSAKDIFEYAFHQGFQRGFDAACNPENRVVNKTFEVTGSKAARAF